MPRNLEKKNKNKIERATEKILQQAAAKDLGKSTVTGLPYEEPLKDEHPGLTAALMYAQPGTVLEKVFAPSMAKGFANSIINGDTEGLISSFVPGSAQIKKVTSIKQLSDPKKLVTELVKDNDVEDVLNTVLKEESLAMQNKFWTSVKSATKEGDSKASGMIAHANNSDLPQGFATDRFGNIRVIPGTEAQQNAIYDALYNGQIDDAIIPMTRSASAKEIESGWNGSKGVLFGGGGVDNSLVFPYFLGDPSSVKNKVSSLKYNVLGNFNPKTTVTQIGHDASIQDLIKAIQSHDPQQAAQLLVKIQKNPVQADSHLSSFIKNAEPMSTNSAGYYNANKQSMLYKWLNSGKQETAPMTNIIDKDGNAIIRYYAPKTDAVEIFDLPQWAVRRYKANGMPDPNFTEIEKWMKGSLGVDVPGSRIDTDGIIKLIDGNLPGTGIYWSRIGDFHGIKAPSSSINPYIGNGAKNPILIGAPESVAQSMFMVPIKKSGGKIKIKKKNKGKFTDYCGGKVTEECIRRGKNSSDPKIRRRATFADNARHWKR